MCCPLFAWKLSIEIGNLASRSVFGLRLEGEDDWEQACIDTERCWKMLKDAESLFQRVSFSLLLPVTHGPGLAHNGHEAQSADRLSSCCGFGWWGQQLRIGRSFHGNWMQVGGATSWSTWKVGEAWFSPARRITKSQRHPVTGEISNSCVRTVSSLRWLLLRTFSPPPSLLATLSANDIFFCTQGDGQHTSAIWTVRKRLG